MLSHFSYAYITSYSARYLTFHSLWYSSAKSCLHTVMIFYFDLSCPFFYLGFLSLNIHKSQDSRRRSRLLVKPHYHFHPLRKHLAISRVITAESSPLHIDCGRTRTGKPLFSECKSLVSVISLRSFVFLYNWQRSVRMLWQEF